MKWASWIEGIVYYQFDIDTKGKITNLKLIKGTKQIEFVQEAFRVLIHSPLWILGVKRGINVEQRFTIPISFKIASTR